jgi:pullulanase
MKKILIVMFALSSFFFLTPKVQALTETQYVYVHYYRYGGDYANWNVWLWQQEPVVQGPDSGFAGYPFIEDDTEAEYNFGGVVSKIPLTDHLEEATTVGILIRRGAWLEKDVDQDRHIDVPATTPNGIFHIYLVEGDFRMGTSINDPNGPSTAPKFIQSYFTSNTTIYFRATEEITPTKITLKANNIVVPIVSVTVDQRTGY